MDGPSRRQTKSLGELGALGESHSAQHDSKMA
jgi:hypothetical protein